MTARSRARVAAATMSTKPRAPGPRDGGRECVAMRDLQQRGGNRAVETLLDSQRVAGVADAPPAGGHPLDPALRTEMESRFGADLHGVRIHDDAQAHDAADALDANAYTVGDHIVFDANRYQPTTATGKRLLAHELAHVIQQSRGGPAPAQSGTPPHEQDAERAASAFAGGAPQVTVAAATSVGIARDGRTADPRLKTFYEPAFFGNKIFSTGTHDGMPKGVWPYDDHLRDLWLAVDTSKPDAYSSAAFEDFADSVKEYQMAVMGLKWSDRNAHGIVDAGTANSLIAKPISAKKPAAKTAAPVTMFDSDYKLASGKATAYDPKTQVVTLSPADKLHLVRHSGFYFFLTHGVRTLIAPPEARTDSDTLDDVLVPITALDLLMLEKNSDPAGYIKDLLKSQSGREVATVTPSAQPDFDFTVDRFTQPGADRTTLESARWRALATRQESTIDDAAQQGKALPMQKLSGMDPDTLINKMSLGERTSWYVRMLGPYQDQLYQSALDHDIPMQLLALVILNELGDIGALDLLQEGTPVADSGSLGIAQIEVSTALKDKLVDVSDADALGAYGRRNGSWSVKVGEPDSDADKLRKGRVYRTSEQLQSPQFAIEAAAREIALLLGKMGQNLDKPWQKNYGFKAQGPCGQKAQDYIPGQPDEEAAEATLAQVVVSAYNSPGIITTTKDAETAFPNGYIHGMNAKVLAHELYKAKLFRAD